MRINKSGRYHQPAGVDLLTPGDLLNGERGDDSAGDSKVADRIETGFRIHNASAQYHQIVGFVGIRFLTGIQTRHKRK